MWTACDPAGQYFNAYGYASNGTNPIVFVDENGEWLGALLGAAAGAYLGGAMSNGFEFNPGKWDWENPGTYMGMIGGGISGASLGNALEMKMVGASGQFTDAYQGKGTVEYQSDGMEVVKENSIPANDLQKLAGQKLSEHVESKQSWWEKFLGHDKLEYKIGASTSGKYEIIAGGATSVETPPSWASKYDIMMHSHPVGTGASAPSFITSGKTPNDYLAVRQWRTAGYQGTHALYVPDTKTFYGYNSMFSNGVVTNSYWELLNVLP